MSFKKSLFSIGVILALSLSFAGCRESVKDEEVTEKQLSDVIQLTPESAGTIGFTTVNVETQRVSGQINTTAEVKANENKAFHINSFVSGRIAQDNVLLGDPIRSGQTLAVVQNLEVAKIQAGYIHELHQNEVEIQKAKTRYELAQKNLERERRLLEEGISPRKDYLQAQSDATLSQADLAGEREHNVHIRAEGKALLSAYGMRPGSVHSERIQTGSPVQAPRSGIVVKKNITLGDMVTPDTIMYEVADLSQIWLDITVYPKDLSSVHVGQSVTFQTDSLPDKTFSGRIDYLQPAANENSHTYIARAYLNNPQGILKPGMFGQAHIAQEGTRNLPYVPEAAIQRYGRETFVFIPLGNQRFRKQTVTLGPKIQDGYLIEQGLKADDKVISQGSFTLKAELLKSQFAEEE